MKQDKTDVRPIFQGLTSVISLINCQRQDYNVLHSKCQPYWCGIGENDEEYKKQSLLMRKFDS